MCRGRDGVYCDGSGELLRQICNIFINPLVQCFKMLMYIACVCVCVCTYCMVSRSSRGPQISSCNKCDTRRRARRRKLLESVLLESLALVMFTCAYVVCLCECAWLYWVAKISTIDEATKR